MVMIMMSAHFGHFMSASFGSVIATSLGQLIAAPVVKLKGYWMTEHIVRWRVKVNRQKSEMQINDRESSRILGIYCRVNFVSTNQGV
jgi:hypothetical protein